VAPQRRVTRELIQDAALRLVERGTLTALTFQALADSLGVSKQAILYWYPSKWELMADCSLPLVRQEADAVIAAVAGSRDATDAIARFVRAFAAHYADRLPQFRVLYMIQPAGIEANAAEQQRALAPVHGVTSSIYASLETWIAGDATFAASGVKARQLAVAVHMSAVGLVTMFALADALGDPLVHSFDSMVEAVVALQGGRSSCADGGPATASGPPRRAAPRRRR
jgi:AcrR family transcriptional regulator